MPEDDRSNSRNRRSFLLLFPFVVCGGVFGSMAVAAFRFLRPRITSATEGWSEVGSLSELSGDSPIARKIATDRISGWALTREERQVFVLPAKDNHVLCAVCPHEGCEVMWDKASNRFSCPCHESYFAPDGARLTGPARRGLDSLPSRIQDGKLLVQYQEYENNAAEKIRRS